MLACGFTGIFDFGMFNLLRELLLPWHENTIIKAHFIILRLIAQFGSLFNIPML